MTPASRALCFRPFRVGDAELLAAWLAGAGLGVPPGVPSRTWASRLLTDPNITCQAAVDETGDGEEAVVGFLRLDTGPDQQAEMTLIVDPDRRRSGLGQLLLEETLRQARGRGLRRIRAVIREGNSVALAFFRAAGFAESDCKTEGNLHLERLIHRAERQPPLEI